MSLKSATHHAAVRGGRVEFGSIEHLSILTLGSLNLDSIVKNKGNIDSFIAFRKYQFRLSFRTSFRYENQFSDHSPSCVENEIHVGVFACQVLAYIWVSKLYHFPPS